MRSLPKVLFASLALLVAATTVAAAQGLVITANPGPARDASRVTAEELFCRGNSVAGRRAVFSAVFSFTGELGSPDTWRKLNEQWIEFLKSELNDPSVNGSCERHGIYPSGILYRDSGMRQMQGLGNQVSVVNWTPKDPAKESGSAVRRKTVFFRGPNPSLKENGYSGVTFDIEYKFLVCDQEVHIAYSILDDSVESEGGNPSYWFGPPGNIQVYKPKVPFPKINSLPLKIVIWKGEAYSSALARLSDVQASKALALTCFAGQTQKVAMLKDHVPKPTPETLTAFLNSLNASFETSMILTSAAAEQEIKAGQGAAARMEAEAAEVPEAAAEAERTARLNREVAERDAAIKRRNAEIKAADERRQREYREALAAQKAEADRIKREDAAAKARYEAEMAAWRVRVAACNAGDVAQCQ